MYCIYFIKFLFPPLLKTLVYNCGSLLCVRRVKAFIYYPTYIVQHDIFMDPLPPQSVTSLLYLVREIRL